MTDVFFITGEASGDAVAAGVARELRSLRPGIQIGGVGGARMRSAGVRLIVESDRWGAIGVAQAIPMVTGILAAAAAIRKHLVSEPPKALVLVDFGALNARMGLWARRRGIKVVYLMPPGSWRRNPNPERTGRLAPAADLFLCPFRWNARNLADAGAKAVHIGHPVLDLTAERADREGVRSRYLTTGGRLIALLPGSRTHEVVTLTPRMVEMAASWPHRVDRFVIVKAPNVSGEWLARMLRKSGASGVAIQEGASADILGAADAAVVCSGTATLEAAALGTPEVVVYDGSRLLRAEYRLRRIRLAAPMVAMPNIIMERMVAPELLMQNATAESITNETLALLDDANRRAAVINDFIAVRRELEPEGALHTAAEHIIEESRI